MRTRLLHATPSSSLVVHSSMDEGLGAVINDSQFFPANEDGAISTKPQAMLRNGDDFLVMVTNLEDHSTSEASLVFFLRVPVNGQQREVEVEF